jgi:hypothetical protein
MMTLRMFSTLTFSVAAEVTWEEWCEQWPYNPGCNGNDSGDEKERRKAVFEEHKAYVEAVNSQQQDFQLSLNKFASIYADELPKGVDRSIMPPPGTTLPSLGEHAQVGELATDVDWQQQGYVTPVKDQGQCGSCWAFATNGAVEAAYSIKAGAGQFVSASEQQLVDCASSYGTAGCKGGWPYNAMQYQQSAGVCSTDSYPYRGVDGSCASSVCSYLPLAVTGYQQVQANSEDALRAAITQGPVTVTVLADRNFQLYTTGTLTGGCAGDIDHAVLAVGYGSGFFKIKNSWGANWGANGYINLASGSNTACLVSEQSTYPVVQAGGPAPSPTPSGCVDLDTSCDYWSNQGFCDGSSQFYQFMTINCKASCHFCGDIEV